MKWTKTGPIVETWTNANEELIRVNRYVPTPKGHMNAPAKTVMRRGAMLVWVSGLKRIPGCL